MDTCNQGINSETLAFRRNFKKVSSFILNVMYSFDFNNRNITETIFLNHCRNLSIIFRLTS